MNHNSSLESILGRTIDAPAASGLTPKANIIQLPINRPVLTHGRYIGKSPKHLYAWIACGQCGEFWWVRFSTGKPTHRICNSCSKKGINQGENNCRWSGGKVDRAGYTLVLARNHPYCNGKGYVREHRLIVEAALGRYLSPREVIHHMDGNRKNNSLDNLKVFASSTEHLAYHRKFKRPD